MADCEEIGDHLPRNVAKFCGLFPPSARLCRIVNRSTGTFLDVRPSLSVVNEDVPRVVLNPESVGVQYWLIVPYGNGQALVPVPRDGSQTVRYLTPSALDTHVTPTVSPFPTSWIILPTARCPEGNPLNAYSIPQGIYEQWTCMISWPHFMDKAVLVTEGPSGWLPNQALQVHPPDSNESWWYWTIQFIRYQRMDSIPPVLPPGSPPDNVSPYTILHSPI